MIIAGIIAFVFLILLSVILFWKRENLPGPVQTREPVTQQKFATQYLTGHSSIKEEEYVYLVKQPGEIKIITRNLYQDNSSPQILATIPYNSITSIEAEDQSGIEKKFSLGRFMLLGAYAFAFLKKEPKERAYLVIKWKEHGQEQATIFSNEGKGALKDVALACNAISSWIKEDQS